MRRCGDITRTELSRIMESLTDPLPNRPDHAPNLDESWLNWTDPSRQFSELNLIKSERRDMRQTGKQHNTR